MLKSIASLITILIPTLSLGAEPLFETGNPWVISSPSPLRGPYNRTNPVSPNTSYLDRQKAQPSSQSTQSRDGKTIYNGSGTVTGRVQFQGPTARIYTRSGVYLGKTETFGNTTRYYDANGLYTGSSTQLGATRKYTDKYGKPVK
jgi:hypothetical protein